MNSHRPLSYPMACLLGLALGIIFMLIVCALYP